MTTTETPPTAEMPQAPPKDIYEADRALSANLSRAFLNEYKQLLSTTSLADIAKTQVRHVIVQRHPEILQHLQERCQPSSSGFVTPVDKILRQYEATARCDTVVSRVSKALREACENAGDADLDDALSALRVLPSTPVSTEAGRYDSATLGHMQNFVLSVCNASASPAAAKRAETFRAFYRVTGPPPTTNPVARHTVLLTQLVASAQHPDTIPEQSLTDELDRIRPHVKAQLQAQGKEYDSYQLTQTLLTHMSSMYTDTSEKAGIQRGNLDIICTAAGINAEALPSYRPQPAQRESASSPTSLPPTIVIQRPAAEHTPKTARRFAAVATVGAIVTAGSPAAAAAPQPPATQPYTGTVIVPKEATKMWVTAASAAPAVVADIQKVTGVVPDEYAQNDTPAYQAIDSPPLDISPAQEAQLTRESKAYDAVSGVVPLAEHALSEWAIQGISPATSESSAAQRLSDLAASLDKQGAQPSLPAAVKERLSLAIALAKAPAAYGNESIRKTIDEHAALSARLPKLPGISEATQQAYLVQYVQERAAAHLKNYYEEDQLDSAEEYQRAIAILLATLEVDSADPGAINAKLLEIHRGTSSPSSPDKPENSAPENQAGAAEWSQERFESFVESLKTLNAKNYGKWPRDIRELADLIWTAAKDNKDSELRLTPERIAAQLFQESKFDPKAVSHVGAKGLAQGMPDTWEAYGKGSPYNPKDAVAFMVNYMNVVYKVVKEKGYTGEKAYLMTLAGYNAGPGRVSERGENLLTDSHWGRGETYNYVRKIPEYVRIIEKTMLPAAETPRPEARTAEVGSEQQNLLEQKLAEKAKDFAWEDGRKADEPKSTYKVEDQEQNAKNRDCGRLVARVLRESGVDENYESSGTPDQEDYVKAHPDKYQNIENTQSTEGLRPGDIFIVGNGYGGKGHTFIYVGEGKIAVASLGHYYPKIGNVYFKDHRGAYRIYRPIASTLLGSSTATP